MLQLKSIINVIDNSGAVWAECIRVLHGGKYARIGNRQVELPEQVSMQKPTATTTLRTGTRTSQRRKELNHRCIESNGSTIQKRTGSFPSGLGFNQYYRSRKEGESQVDLISDTVEDEAWPGKGASSILNGAEQSPRCATLVYNMEYSGPRKRMTLKKAHRQARLGFR